LWGSIGYTIGAGLGATLADRQRRTIILVGDGAFQMSAQEISTMIRYRLNPIVFLLDNAGYSIERAIHPPAFVNLGSIDNVTDVCHNTDYNDIQSWRYTLLPHVFGGDGYTISVQTRKELDAVLTHLPQVANNLCLIQLTFDPYDYPEILVQAGSVTPTNSCSY
jgi:pyruvate decarboxylase/indolepyruvate decarboxylase